MSTQYSPKTINGDKLIWWKQKTSEAYWYEHFKRQIDSHYQSIAKGITPRIAELLQPYLPKSGRVLEAGCGTGWIVYFLNQLGYSVEGVDYSEDLIKLVRELHPELPVRFGDVCALDVADGFYSAYISL